MATDKDPPRRKKKKKKGKKKDRSPSRVEPIKKDKKDKIGVSAKHLEEQLKRSLPKKKRSKKKDRPYVGVTPEMLKGSKPRKKADPEEATPLLCPDCGHEIEEGLKKCPECGVALGEGEEMVCAVCGSHVDESVGVCLMCGTKFMSKEAAEKATDIPIEDFVHHRRRKRKKPSVKIGKEEVGPKEPAKRKKAVAKKRKRPRAKARRRPPPKKTLISPAMMLMVIVVIAVLVAAIFSVLSLGSQGMVVDGQFDDWDDVIMHEDTAQTGRPDNVNIVEYGVQTQEDDLFLFLSTKGKIFPGQETSPTYVNIFIDSDGNPDTSYIVNSIGAEHRIEIKGWSGVVKSAKYYSFDPSGDPNDWTAFVETGNIQAAASGNKLELAKALSAFGLDGGSRPAICFSVKDTDGEMDLSEAPIGIRPGGISMTQYIKAPTIPVPPGSNGQVFINIKIEAKGIDDTFESMTVSRLGKGTPGDISSITLWSGDVRVDDGKFEDLPRSALQQVHLEPKLLVTVKTPVVLTLKMDIWVKAVSPTIGALVITTNDLTFKRSPVILHTIQDGALISYINKTPSQPTVDGAWGDWNNANSNDIGFLGDSSEPNIKFTEIRSRAIADGHISLSVEVAGQALSGSPIPDYEVKNGDCGPGPRCPGTGEDVLIIYIDDDSDSATGVPIASVGAEYAVIVQGKYGIIDHDSLGFYDYDSGKGIWEKLSDTGVTAFTDNHRIEVELDFSKSGLISSGNDYRYGLELRNSLYGSSMSSVIPG